MADLKSAKRGSFRVTAPLSPRRRAGQGRGGRVSSWSAPEGIQSGLCSSRIAVIEAYKKDVDRTLIRENLKLTPDERLRKLQSFMKFLYEIRGAARRRQ